MWRLKREAESMIFNKYVEQTVPRNDGVKGVLSFMDKMDIPTLNILYNLFNCNVILIVICEKVVYHKF